MMGLAWLGHIILLGLGFGAGYVFGWEKGRENVIQAVTDVLNQCNEGQKSTCDRPHISGPY